MKNGETLQKIVKIFLSEPRESQEAFISDLRRSLTETHSQFNKTASLLLLLIGSHYLSVSGVDESVTLFGIDFPETPIFHSSILLVSSVVFLALTCLRYLKKYQRECYILSLMTVYPNINETGLHELRLPSNALLSADMLRYDSDLPQRIVGIMSWKILSYAHFALPLVYILHFLRQSALSLSVVLDVGVLLVSIVSFILVVLSVAVMYFHGKIE